MAQPPQLTDYVAIIIELSNCLTDFDKMRNRCPS